MSGRFETYQQMPEYSAKKAVEALTPIRDDAQLADGFYVDGVLYGYKMLVSEENFELWKQMLHCSEPNIERIESEEP